MNHRLTEGLWSKLRIILSLSIILMVGFLFSGCVEQNLTADKTDVIPGESVTLTTVCTPADSGSNDYLWFCVEAPAGSEHRAFPWKELDSTTNQQVFTPDVVGQYKLESKVFAGIFGFNIAAITINCTGTSAWDVDPTSLDFGYIQTEKEKVTITNTGNINIDIEVLPIDFQNQPTADWLTDVQVAATLGPGESTTVSVGVDRAGMDSGEYNTSFVVLSDQCGSQIIDVTMGVGPAKILFCVDTSGSMEWNDPDAKRVDAVKATIGKFYNNERIEFGIVSFADNATIETGFTRGNNEDDMKSKADVLAAETGYTNYFNDSDGALDRVAQLTNGLAQEECVVIFLSDGEPTAGYDGLEDIVGKVEEITTPANIKLYTIYLLNNNPDDDPQALLNGMAAGGGTQQALVINDPDYLSFIDLDF